MTSICNIENECPNTPIISASNKYKIKRDLQKNLLKDYNFECTNKLKKMKDNLDNYVLSHELQINSSELHITNAIGKGQFGVVEKGLWRGTDIAIKILADNDVDINIDDFFKEIMILSRLHHPNILQLLGISFNNAPYSIIMEYMENGSLADHINSRKFGFNQRINVLKDISKGLAYLHNRKPNAIIHRDLKPSNILLSTSFKAKIADFGISCLKSNVIDDTYDLTGETGTYRWMAPEVMKCESYNNKVDIFSFGMVCYALFVEDPYRSLTLDIIFKSIKSDVVPLNTRLKKFKKLSNSLKDLIINTTIYEKEKRWDTLYLVNYCNSKISNNDFKKEYRNISCFCK